MASNVFLSSIVSDVSYTSQRHDPLLHRKTTPPISRIELSTPFISPLTLHCYHILLHSRHYPLVVFSTTLSSSTSSSSLSSNNTTNFENYLINSLGFSEEQSRSISTKLVRFREGRVPRKVTDFNFENNDESVVTLLQETGLDQSHIRNVVAYDPRILFVNVDKTLKPRINLLHELGFSGPDIARLTSSNPGLFIGPLNSAVEALRAVLDSDEDVATALKKSTWNWVGSAKCLVPNVALLESYGVPRDRIRKAVLRVPSVFTRTPELFRHVLNRVEEKWRVPRDSAAFIYAVQLLCANSEETIDSKCRLFKSFGWTDSELRVLMRQYPRVLTFSEVRIKNSLEFLMNELGYESSYLASISYIFTYNIEKRLAPRHRVLQILKDKGLDKADYKLCSAAVLTESTFLAKFIQPYKEVVPDLHEIYVNLQQGSSYVAVETRESEVSSPQTKTDYMFSSAAILSEA